MNEKKVHFLEEETFYKECMNLQFLKNKKIKSYCFYVLRIKI